MVEMLDRNVKGFRDFLPSDMRVREGVLKKITEVFERFGFEVMETPVLEHTSVLEGKYGEDERLIYKFETPGGDKVSLKYDQTVPLARVIAQYGPRGEQKINIPFKRYQIQNVYRGENPQKGRYREFLQCDVDIIGVESALADAEILALAYEVYSSLGLAITLKISDRVLFGDLENKYLASLDKLHKIGRDGVLAELQKRGKSQAEASEILAKVEGFRPSERLVAVIDAFEMMGYDKRRLVFDPFLIRGLDYYTSMIVEAVPEGNLQSSSLGGGGRWDNMIGKFTGVDTAAVGFSVGVDRVIEELGAVGATNKFSECRTKVLISVFNVDLAAESLKLVSLLRLRGINAECWLELNTSLDKQLKYADKKGIPFVLVIGEDEVKSSKVSLKDMQTGQTILVSIDELVAKLSP